MSFFDADYSGIQARIVCWLAGQQDALDRFRAYDKAKTKEEKTALDPYRIMASSIFNILVEQVNKFPQRFVGKEAVLGAGFGLGPPRFRVSCKDKGKIDLPLGLEFKAIKTWRRVHHKVVKMWENLEEAAKAAIIKGGMWKVGKLLFFCKDVEGLPFLLIQLPSGRKMAYPRPRVVPHKRFTGKTCIVYFGHIKGAMWGDVDIWGGTLAENVTMGVESDVMLHGIHNAEKVGYEMMTNIHDQVLTYVKEGQTAEGLVSILTTLPPWADGLPIAAEGELVPFYKKS